MAPKKANTKRKHSNDTPRFDEKKLKLHNTLSEEPDEDNTKYELLSYQNIMEGMLILGCVVEIRDHYFICSLPGCLRGKVPDTNISDKYSEILRDNNNHKYEKEPSLQSIIKLGMVIPCKVMSVTSSKFSNKTREIILSVNPRDVNENLKLNSFYSKMVLYASVKSIEDHGYILDVGVPGLQGFIRSFTDDGEKLIVGQVLPVFVMRAPKMSSNVIQLSKLELNENFPTIDEENIKLSSILPGSRVSVSITEVKHPLVLMTYQNFNVCASTHSIRDPEKMLNNECEILCKVLYVHPVTHVIYVCFGATPTPETFSSYFGFKKYEVVQNIKFRFWCYNQGYCSFKKTHFGFFQKRDLKDNRSVNFEDLKAEAQIAKARVLLFHYMDNLIELSIKDSWVDQQIISPEEVQLGDVFQGVVLKHLPFGMFVQICPGFTGYVKNIHMSDVHVTKPEKLLPIGTKVTCRVVALIPNKKPYFTCKDSLMSLPTSAMLSSYEDAHKGMCVTGVVKSVENHCIYVLFFQNIQGILPLESVPKECVLFNGQTIVCEITFCDPERKRLKLSVQNVSLQTFSSNSFGTANSKKGNENRIKKKLTRNQSNARGSQFEDQEKPCRALIKGVTASQINLLLPDKTLGRIHITELGCTQEDVSPLETYSKGEHIDVYVVGNFLKKSCNFLEISHQNMVKFYECSLSYPPPIPIVEHFQIGMPVLGFVKEVDDFSSSLWLSPSQIGTLDHINFSECPKILRKLKKNLHKGLSVLASVLEVEDSNNRQSSSKVSLTKIGSTLPEVGRNIVGLVQAAFPQTGILLKLPNGYSGSVDLTDTQDVFKPLNEFLAKLRRLKFVLCHVLQVNHDTKYCSLSLRKSRVYKEQATSTDTFCPELTIDNVEIGKFAKGFVKVVLNKSLLINFGRMLDGEIKLHKCALECSECKYSSKVIKKYVVGSVIDVIIGELDILTDSYSLSHASSKPLTSETKEKMSISLPWEEEM